MLTKEQKTALHKVWLRGTPSELTPTYRNNGAGLQTYLTFRRTAWESFDCVMVPWCNMLLGIERDGYTHS
jgi:hypothetical protein